MAKKEIKMTTTEFRRIALSMPEASESAHMDHPDFRVGGKIFATLGYPDANHGMVVLPPEEQKRFVKSDSVAFAPAKGAWGRRGSTCVRLEAVDVPILRRAMEIAWRKRAPKRLASAMRRNQGGAPFSARHNQPGRKLSRRDIGN